MSRGDLVEEHFREWLLRAMTGCHFAARVAAGPRLTRPRGAPPDVPELLNVRLDGVDQQHAEIFTNTLGQDSARLCVALLPGVTAAAEIADFARNLPGAVGFIDMPTGLDGEAHKAMLAKTNESVKGLVSTSGNDMRALRDVAFSLPSASVRRLVRQF